MRPQNLIALFILFLYAASAIPDKKLLPKVDYKAAIVMDSKTKQILYAYNIHKKLPPASLTKLMTAIIIVESGKLQEVATVGANPTKIKASSIGLKEGEKIVLQDLLSAILLRSANDACLAAAEYLAGSESLFVELVNKKAAMIGAINTNFVNSHGLDASNHYSTAYDLALIAAYACKQPAISNIVRCKYKMISRLYYPKAQQQWLKNRNKFLWQYKYADGIKTGYTKLAGRCLAASATQNSWQLICILLNSKDLWGTCAELLDDCFLRFKPFWFAKAGELVHTLKVSYRDKPEIRLLAKDCLYWVVERQKPAPAYEVKIEVLEKLPAKIYAGDVLGKLKIILDGGRTLATDLVACEDSHFKSSIAWLSYTFYVLVAAIIIAAIILKLRLLSRF